MALGGMAPGEELGFVAGSRWGMAEAVAEAHADGYAVAWGTAAAGLEDARMVARVAGDPQGVPPEGGRWQGMQPGAGETRSGGWGWWPAMGRRGGAGRSSEGAGATCLNCQFALWDGGREESRTGRCLIAEGTACQVHDGGLIAVEALFRGGETCGVWRERV